MNKNKLKERIAHSAKKSHWIEGARNRIAEDGWREVSFLIALKILRYIRENEITQKAIAQNMGCSPQFLNKILKGRENLTLETIFKLQEATGLKLIQIPSEDKQVMYKGLEDYAELQNVVNEPDPSE